MLFYFWLSWPFCSIDQNHLCNFGGEYYEEHLCRIIAVQEMSFKSFSNFSSGDHFAQSRGTICAILVEELPWFTRVIQ